MNILVTGGAGFIGSHLTEALIAEGHDVTIIDNLSTGSLSNIAAVRNSGRCTFVQGTILDKTVFASIHPPEIIFHLAAAVGVKYILDNPLTSIHTNVLGAENVFEYAHRSNAKIILTSTSEVYGKSPREVLTETDDHIIGSTFITRWSYACAKALDEFIAFAYYRNHNLPIVIARLFNTCGPRQSSHYGMVLPRFITQALRGQPLTVYGSGEQIRTFTYVSDVVEALIRLATVPSCVGEVFNIGGQDPVAIKELAALVTKKTKSTSTIAHVPYTQAYGNGFEDMMRRVPNITKIRSYVGFVPRVNLDAILDKTIAHIRNQENTIVAEKLSI